MTLSRIAMILVFVGALGYLYHKHTKPPPPPPPPPPPILNQQPPIVLSQVEIDKIRVATMDTDPNVRWSAINLLYTLRDPKAHEILEKTLALDTESQVRQNALNILKSPDQPEAAKTIVPALKDSEKEIRLATLMALGEIGDPGTIPEIIKLLADVEPDVRLQVLYSLGRIQEKKAQEFRAAQEEMRVAYEKQLNEYKGIYENPFDRQKAIDKAVK